ncbi:MAG: hypothetical protein M1832_002661 [Thelocarpon impressellum]|nr:MAG: hypothetical protein M1832_002661 [Thelocarpon impressellum]
MRVSRPLLSLCLFCASGVMALPLSLAADPTSPRSLRETDFTPEEFVQLRASLLADGWRENNSTTPRTRTRRADAPLETLKGARRAAEQAPFAQIFRNYAGAGVSCLPWTHGNASLALTEPEKAAWRPCVTTEPEPAAVQTVQGGDLAKGGAQWLKAACKGDAESGLRVRHKGDGTSTGECVRRCAECLGGAVEGGKSAGYCRHQNADKSALCFVMYDSSL